MRVAEVTGRRRLAVWGDPIGHSRSPQIHSAAYAVLGRDWVYDRRQVGADGFSAALSSLDDTWRGLSLTMPLKEVAHRAATTLDHAAEATGAVNTLLLTAQERHGYNTDVGGIVDAFRAAGVAQLATARILGAGSTAASALVAAVALGATRIQIVARRPEAAKGILDVAHRLDIDATVVNFGAASGSFAATIATLPSGTVLDPDVATRLSATGGALFEAAYAPWPSALASAWHGGPVISGLDMLLFQAVRQVRIFVDGDQDRPLPREDVMVSAMRRALVGD